MAAPAQLAFLPGASGDTSLWEPVAEQLQTAVRSRRHIGWPGFGPTPADPSVTTLAHLVQRVSATIDQPTALIAHSMGGVVALLAALDKPQLVTHLVLSALSGGIDLARHGGRNWRPPRSEITGALPYLFAAYDDDLSPRLPSIATPTLLLWGDQDAVSPVAAGQWLSQVLPHARLYVVRGGAHTFARAHAGEIAPLIDGHLSV
jgi:pimeloyl-ACP methyl ester carboxylesterase